MKTKEETVIYISNGIGYTDGKRFVSLPDQKHITARCYNGRMCFQIGKKRIGIKTWKTTAARCSIKITSTPF